MVQFCAAYGCNSQFSKGCGVSFHRFKKNAELMRKWALSTKRKDFKPNDTTVLCSKHFQESDYELGGMIKKLKSNSVSSVFDFPSNLHLQSSSAKHRRSLFRSEIQKHIEINHPHDENGGFTSNSDIPNEQDAPKDGATASSSTIKNKTQVLSPTKMLIRRKIKILQQKLKRREKRIRTMSDMISVLKKKV